MPFALSVAGVVKRNQSLLQSALDKQRTRLLGEEKHKFNVHIGHSKARPTQNGEFAVIVINKATFRKSVFPAQQVVKITVSREARKYCF